MPEQLERLRAWLQTHEGKKIFRYTMVSVISTGVSLFVLVIVYGVARLWTEVPSTVFANCVASFPSYWLNRNWAWGKSGRSHLLKEVIPFWAAAAGGIAFSIIGASLARSYGHQHHLGHLTQTALVVGANFASFAVFWVLKLLLFNRVFRVVHIPTVLEEMDEHLQVEEHSGSGAPRETSEGAGVR